MRILLYSLFSAVVSAVAAFAVALVFLAFNDWFGVGDLGAFGFWSVPFAGFMAVICAVIALSTKRVTSTFRYTLGSISGLAAGFVFTWLVSRFLGPWFGAFSFPVLYCWMIGGLSAVVFSVKFTGNVDA